MANIKLGDGVQLEFGTGGDDVVTLDRGLIFDAEDVLGARAAADAAVIQAQNILETAEDDLNAFMSAGKAATISALDVALSATSAAGAAYTAPTTPTGLSVTAPTAPDTFDVAEAMDLVDDLNEWKDYYQDYITALGAAEATAQGNLNDLLNAVGDGNTANDQASITALNAAVKLERDELSAIDVDRTAAQTAINNIDAQLDGLTGLNSLIGAVNTASGNLTQAQGVQAAAIADTVDHETLDGNGGTDSLVLTQETLQSILGEPGASIAYSPLNDGVWTIEDGDANTGSVTASNGFTSITTADGTVLQAGVATSGISDVADVNGTADVALARAYTWNGSEFSVNTLLSSLPAANNGSGGVSIISVDGLDVDTLGPVFQNGEGQFSVSGTDVTFTPETAAITAQGNAGDTATFTYDVVVEDNAGTQYTVSISFEQEIPFTIEDDVWVGSDAGDVINANYEDGDSGTTAPGGNDMLDGGAGNDEITASTGNDTVYGRTGEDFVDGGAGNDTVFGGQDDDDLFGNDGDDELRGGAGNDDIYGQDDDDLLIGAGGNDYLAGGADDDTLFAGGGNDTLDGGTGSDKVNGGNGNDYLYGDAEPTALLGGGFAPVNHSAGSATDNDTLKGGDGDDHLYGQDGSDELRGGAGEDYVHGGDGDDLIFSSLGGDTLVGGDGDDTFVLKAGTGNTTITDFGTGNDKLDVEELGLESLADVTAISYETSQGMTMVIDADTTVTLEGVSLSDLSIADFDFA